MRLIITRGRRALYCRTGRPDTLRRVAPPLVPPHVPPPLVRRLVGWGGRAGQRLAAALPRRSSGVPRA